MVRHLDGYRTWCWGGEREERSEGFIDLTPQLYRVERLEEVAESGVGGSVEDGKGDEPLIRGLRIVEPAASARTRVDRKSVV